MTQKRSSWEYPTQKETPLNIGRNKYPLVIKTLALDEAIVNSSGVVKVLRVLLESYIPGYEKVKINFLLKHSFENIT